MSKLLQLLSGGVVKQVGEVLDNLTTSKEEKLNAQKAIKEILLKADSEAQQQVTKRWDSDMKSDSFLSKNIRPLIILLFSSILFNLIVFICFYYYLYFYLFPMSYQQSTHRTQLLVVIER